MVMTKPVVRNIVTNSNSSNENWNVNKEQDSHIRNGTKNEKQYYC